MAPIYTQTQLLSDVNGLIKGKSGILVDAQSTLNQGVRQVLADLDLVTTRRRARLLPNLFNGLFEYASPIDLKGYSIISIQDQIWSRTPFWKLVPYEQFMRRQEPGTISVSDYDFMRKLFIKSYSSYNNTSTVVSNLDSITSGGGTWGAFGDAVNVESGSDNFVEGVASIKFDISGAAGTTAGIVNLTLSSVDVSAYFHGDGTGIAWAYIVSTTGLTSYTIRYGSDSSNYYSKTVTTQADGTAFITGWNLLDFNLATFTTTGTPVETAMDYCAIYMNKDITKINEVGYRFDCISLRKGQINNVYYYSGYGWQSSAGTYKVNSTASTDLLNAGEEEYELIKSKCAELAADEVDEEKVSEKQSKRYSELKRIYQMNNPSEALVMNETYATFVKV